MKLKKVLLGVALFSLITIASSSKTKAEWVDSSGTARGFSSDFYYVIESNWNRINTQQGVQDDMAGINQEGRLYSDGQVWITPGIDCIIDVTNGRGTKYPVTRIEVADPSIAEFSFYGNGTVTYGKYYIRSLKYGVTSLYVERSNGDSFTVPINVVPRPITQNDEGTYSKDVVLGLGQSITPYRCTVNCNEMLPNVSLHEIWTSSNPSVVEIGDYGRITAKSVGTATVTCCIYDKMSCMNKYHYSDEWVGKKIIYSIKVQETTPVIQIKNEDNESLNQKILTKEVGDTIQLSPSLTEVSSVIWLFSSNKEEVASVNNSGIVTAKAVGSAIITVKGAEQNSTFTLNVIPKKVPETATSAAVGTTGDVPVTASVNSQSGSRKVVRKEKKKKKVKKNSLGIKKVRKRKGVYVLTVKGTKYKGYEVYYGTTKKCKKRIGLGKTRKLAFTLKLKKNKKYFFRVRGVVKTGEKAKKSKFSRVYIYKSK